MQLTQNMMQVRTQNFSIGRVEGGHPESI
jgi:hypothetical protein